MGVGVPGQGVVDVLVLEQVMVEVLVPEQLVDVDVVFPGRVVLRMVGVGVPEHELVDVVPEQMVVFPRGAVG